MDLTIPFASLLFQDMVSTAEMRQVWSETNTIRKWLDVERAILEAQAELGLIPQAAAAAMGPRLSPEVLTAEKIREKKDAAGHLMVSILKAFRELCGPDAEHFHVGATTQDILDTGLTLQMREAHGIVMRQMLELEDALCEQALRHKGTIMMGRTHGQQAVPYSLGFVLGGWAGEVRDHIERARQSEGRWLFGNLSGAVGAQNAFVELSDSATAQELQRRMCARLNLKAPLIDLHGRVDRFAEPVTNLAALCSSLGRMGLNLRSWQRSEVMEVEEPSRPTVWGSSTMPNKKNPEPSEQVEGLATLARALALAVQDLQVAEHRDATRMPVEFTAVPLVHMMAARALQTTATNISGLVVRADNMLKNLEHPNVLGQAAGERLMIALYKKTGRKDWAHNELHRCARVSRETGRHFREVVREDPVLGPYFADDELSKLMDLTTYTGSAAHQAEAIVAAIRQRRALAGEGQP